MILHLPRRLALVLRRHLRLHHELEALGSGDLAHAGRSSRGRGHSLPASTGFGLGGGGGRGGKAVNIAERCGMSTLTTFESKISKRQICSRMTTDCAWRYVTFRTNLFCAVGTER